MLLNDLLGMLMDVPPLLASQWAAWFVVGLILSIWGRHEKTRLVVHASTRNKSGVRQAVRSPSGVRLPVAARTAPAAPASGDAFAELEALLEQPIGSHRMPGESLELAEAEAPEPPLGAPRSLP
jgi:hypothetical protein